VTATSHDPCPPAAKDEVVEEMGEVSHDDKTLSIDREMEESTDVEDS
jgi:hypothetical protein